MFQFQWLQRSTENIDKILHEHAAAQDAKIRKQTEDNYN